MSIAITLFVIMTLIGFVPIYLEVLKSASSTIDSDAKYLKKQPSDLLEAIKNSVDDRLKTSIKKSRNSKASQTLSLKDVGYFFFEDLTLCQGTPLRETVLCDIDNTDVICGVVRFIDYPIRELGINNYLFAAMVDGTFYEIRTNTSSPNEIVFFRNGRTIGFLKQIECCTKGFRKLLDFDQWDVFIDDQSWGKLNNHGKTITSNSYKIDIPETGNLTVKIAEKECSYVRCLFFATLFFTLWTLWPYWITKTGWIKRKNKIDAILPHYEQELSELDTEMYFLINLMLRLVIFGRDYRTTSG